MMNVSLDAAKMFSMKKNKPSHLKKIMFLSGYSQLEIAKKLGVHRSRIALWANGWESVPTKYHRRLSQILRCKYEDIGQRSRHD